MERGAGRKSGTPVDVLCPGVVGCVHRLVRATDLYMYSEEISREHRNEAV